MNRSNVLELKKQMSTIDECIIDKISTCFVNGEKHKLISNTESFWNLEQEEQFKYMDMFKASLTGAIGKKLINVQLTDKTSKDSLAGYYKNFSNDEAQRDELFDKIIEGYDFGENYLIAVAHATYDVPLKAADGAKLEDSVTSYEFMLVSICPVHSTKAGLTLDAESGRMVNSGQIQIVQAPANGFLYPAFNDRDTDEDALLYFTKKPEEQHSELIQALIGTEPPTSSAEQQRIFENIISELTDNEADFEVIKNLQDNLTNAAKDNTQLALEKKYDKDDIKDVLKQAGISSEKMEKFDDVYEKCSYGMEMKFLPQNLITIDKFKVKAPDVEIKIKPNKRNLVTKQKVSGKECIVIELEEGKIELNGISIKE